MKKNLITVFLIAAGQAYAGNIDAISGHYIYENFQYTLADGRVVGLEYLGAQSAELMITPAMKISLTIKKLDGKTVKSEAKILEMKLSGNSGYLLAQWENMNYPVKEELTLIPGGLKYVINFTNPADAMRYRTRDEATLKKVSR